MGAMRGPTTVQAGVRASPSIKTCQCIDPKAFGRRQKMPKLNVGALAFSASAASLASATILAYGGLRHNSPPPIIALTASAYDGGRRQCLAMGIKPPRADVQYVTLLTWRETAGSEKKSGAKGLPINTH